MNRPEMTCKGGTNKIANDLNDWMNDYYCDLDYSNTSFMKGGGEGDFSRLDGLGCTPMKKQQRAMWGGGGGGLEKKNRQLKKR